VGCQAAFTKPTPFPLLFFPLSQGSASSCIPSLFSENPFGLFTEVRSTSCKCIFYLRFQFSPSSLFLCAAGAFWPVVFLSFSLSSQSHPPCHRMPPLPFGQSFAPSRRIRKFVRNPRFFVVIILPPPCWTSCQPVKALFLWINFPLFPTSATFFFLLLLFQVASRKGRLLLLANSSQPK